MERQVEVTKGAAGWRTEKGYSATNKSGFRATGHRVLLLGCQLEETTASGIIIQKKTAAAERDLSVLAVVVEIGQDCWFDKSTDYCAVGNFGGIRLCLRTFEAVAVQSISPL